MSKQLTIVVGLTVVGFMAFGLALSFYRNVLFEDTLANMRSENDKIRQENSQAQDDLEYYRSTQFKDKYAKENLGRMNRGEKVLLLTQNPKAPDLTPDDALSPTEEQDAAFDEMLRQMPILQHWELFLFRRNKIEDLKKAM